ncbi:C-type lectin domain family 4 member D-like [Mastacembelus armatus]|nr:C-type lectin domain family 4 member D-like [Mastacembelus armatus]
MSSPSSAQATEGMYYKLIDDDHSHGTGVAHGAHPVCAVRVTQSLRGPGPYRLATICLAALCAVLLISIIAITAHYKNKPQGGGNLASDSQHQGQDVNVSLLTATIHKLQEEKQQLQKEKDELQVKLAATKAPCVIKPTTKAPPIPSPIVCSSDWRLFNNSCYFISTIRHDWEDSQSFCQTHGGHLAIIHTAEEQTFLWDLLPRGHWNSYWFGITDEHTEDQWKWVDGTPLVGGFWEVGEPNNHINEDCGYIVKTTVLERVAIRSWYDAPCSMTLPFICEKEMGTNPQ